MRRFLALTSAALLLQFTPQLNSPLLAQDKPAETTQEEDEAGGPLVRFLENTLSNDSRTIRVTGLEGALSSQATIQSIEVSDTDGVWFRLTGAVLDWNRLALVRGRFSVNELSAQSIEILRAPLPSTDAEAPAPEAQPFAMPELPVSIEIGKLAVAKIDLAEDVIGLAATLEVRGNLTLADGALDTDLTIDRLDRTSDQIAIKASFANETRQIGVDIRAQEAAGGLISKLLSLPDSPPVTLTIKGDGPVTDFAADLSLATDQIQRVSGRVSLTGQGEGDAQDIAFDAKIEGDLRPLLAPDFTAFFGPQTRLHVAGQRAASNEIDISTIALAADALSVNGAVSLDAQTQPTRVNLDIALGDAQGGTVVLPVPDGKTTVQGITAKATFDSAQGPDWTLSAQIDQFAQPGLTLGSAKLTAAGQYTPEQSIPLTGTLQAQIAALGFADAALRKGVGDSMSLDGEFSLSKGETLNLSNFALKGSDYAMVLDMAVSGLNSGFGIDGTVKADLSDLSRFDALADRPIAGALTATLTGKGDPLGGVFSFLLEGTGTELRAGSEALDKLLIGDTNLTLDAERGPNGLQIRQLRLNGEALTADASGSVKTGRADLTLTASLDDLARVMPDLPGPVTVSGTASQRRDTWTADLDIDAPGGAQMTLDATVPMDLGPDLAFDLSLSEPAGGPVGQIIGIPGGPALSLDARGGGALSDFLANIALATEGTDRLSGVVTLREDADPSAATANATATAFQAKLSGDATPFLAQQFHDFFGTNAQLNITGLRNAEGQIDLSALDIDTGALRLTGTAQISAQGKPLSADLDIALGTGTGTTRLPVPGDPIDLRRAVIKAQLDGQSGDAWSLSANVDGLTHPQASLNRLTLRGQGTISSTDILAVAGSLTAGLQGLSMTDPALRAAIGPSLSLDGQFNLPGDDTLSLDTLTLRGQDMELLATANLSDLSDSQTFEANTELRLTDLGRFSGLAKRPLTGRASSTLSASGTLSDQSIDILLTGLFQDITTGIAQADTLLAGEYHLRADASTQADGLDLRSLILTGPSLKLRANGLASPTTPDLQATLTLPETARLVPNLTGETIVDLSLTTQDADLQAKIALQGPNSSYANAQASLSPNGDADISFETEFKRLERLIAQLPGTLQAAGTAQRRADLWQFDTSATGPAGIETNVTGAFDQAAGTLDATAKGNIQMAVANAALSPISAKGNAGFDLTIQGPPALGSVSGQITLSQGAIAIPQIQNAVQNFTGTVSLSDSSAALALRGDLRTGGSFSVNGPVALAAPFDGNIAIALQELILTDEVVYRAPVSGKLSFSGPLAGAATLAGRIDIGETEIDIGNVGGSSSAAPIPDLVHVSETGAMRATRSRAGLIKTSSGSGGPAIGLDLLISAPKKIFVRGRGLDAELGGELYVGGTTANVAPSGQIKLIRGIMGLFGRRLELDRGLITLQGSLEPYMEFAATSSTSSGSATLEMSGQLDSLDISVTSDPELPEEEALALLLFGNEFSTLSPFKLAQIAAGLLTLRGGGNFVGDAGREATGADSVSLANDSSGAPSLGLGGYVSDNIYTDVAVNIDGNTELNINLDVTDSLTIKGSVDNEGQSGIGLFFDRDY